MVKSGLFCWSGGDRARPGLDTCDRWAQLGASSWREFSLERGLVFRPGEGWGSPNTHACQSQSFLRLVAVI
ncbi:hypothetical protein MPNT_70053 [Candidatus Methylacidithermus pantelleriae]|uniref:Uncharacterized protein n=1 Tax=Candidatus Methylacidithermus pantelleriae TaxID=2744239 RepID=A0A8J2BPK0_9BACT|nr:hypothetical protein MPNT_70053 [Candidatus Methylacidithermus pantelleriae]